MRHSYVRAPRIAIRSHAIRVNAASRGSMAQRRSTADQILAADWRIERKTANFEQSFNRCLRIRPLDDGYLCDAAPNVALTVVIEIADATAIVAEELVPVVAFPVEHAVQQIIHAGRVCLRRTCGEPEKRRRVSIIMARCASQPTVS
jgi:hypothetical protein